MALGGKVGALEESPGRATSESAGLVSVEPPGY